MKNVHVDHVVREQVVEIILILLWHGQEESFYGYFVWEVAGKMVWGKEVKPDFA
jgi:hypothetical protein